MNNPEMALAATSSRDTTRGERPGGVSRRLFISHFISTWNSRSFEFGATLFLAAAFPGSLLQVSIYAVVRAAAAIVFSSAVGHYIDTGGRLEVVRTSIVTQRISTALSCILFLPLVLDQQPFHDLRYYILAALCLLACVEKLSSILNLVSVERDWVVVIAGEDERFLQTLNAQMRRIDLFCKLVGPLIVALFDGISSWFAIVATLGLNVLSVPVEYYTIAWVYHSVPELAGFPDPAEIRLPGEPDEAELSRGPSPIIDAAMQPQPPPLASSRASALSCLATSFTCVSSPASQALQQIRVYVRSAAFLPSLSLSLLYLNVLSFNGQTVTYLLTVGFTPWHVALLRLASITVELSATWLGPLLARRIGSVRAGIWFLNWELVCLALATAYFFPHSGGGTGASKVENLVEKGFASAASAIAARLSESPGLVMPGIRYADAQGSSMETIQALISASTSAEASVSTNAALVLVVGIVLSRLGLWGFDLSAQAIIQETVSSNHRGAFSTAEAATQNAFELAAFVTTAIWSRPYDFRYPVLISVGAVALAGVLYAMFVRHRRGHLLHLPCGVESAGKWRRSMGNSWLERETGLIDSGISGPEEESRMLTEA